MTRMAQATATAPSTLPEQSISATFLVEVTTDLDTGEPTLISSSDPHLGDLQVVTAAQVAAAADAEHRKLDAGVRLAFDFEAQQRRQALTDGREQAVEKVAEIVLGYAEKADDPIGFLNEWAKAYQAASLDSGSHYPWCEPGACVTYEGEDGPVTEHHGRPATITAPEGFTGGNGKLLHAYLIDDGCGAPAVSAIDATGNGTLLGTEAFDQLIEQGAAALNQMRVMSLQMKAAQA